MSQLILKFLLILNWLSVSCLMAKTHKEILKFCQVFKIFRKSRKKITSKHLLFLIIYFPIHNPPVHTFKLLNFWKLTSWVWVLMKYILIINFSRIKLHTFLFMWGGLYTCELVEGTFWNFREFREWLGKIFYLGWKDFLHGVLEMSIFDRCQINQNICSGKVGRIHFAFNKLRYINPNFSHVIYN